MILNSLTLIENEDSLEPEKIATITDRKDVEKLVKESMRNCHTNTRRWKGEKDAFDDMLADAERLALRSKFHDNDISVYNLTFDEDSLYLIEDVFRELFDIDTIVDYYDDEDDGKEFDYDSLEFDDDYFDENLNK